MEVGFWWEVHFRFCGGFRELRPWNAMDATLNQSSKVRSLVSKLGLSLSGKPLSEISWLTVEFSPSPAKPRFVHLIIWGGGTGLFVYLW